MWQQYLTTRISDRLSKILDKLLQKSLLQSFQLADAVMLAMSIEAKTPNYSSPACPGKCLYTLTGNFSNTLAISPDGNIMASGGDDKIIKLWDLNQPTLVNSVKGHSQAVTSVAFSPKQELLATARDDKTIKLWHLPTQEEIFTLEGHSHLVFDSFTEKMGLKPRPLRQALKTALGTTGHVGTWILDPNATLRERQRRTGDSTSTHAGEILCEQVGSMNEQSPHFEGGESQIPSLKR